MYVYIYLHVMPVYLICIGLWFYIYRIYLLHKWTSWSTMIRFHHFYNSKTTCTNTMICLYIYIHRIIYEVLGLFCFSPVVRLSKSHVGTALNLDFDTESVNQLDVSLWPNMFFQNPGTFSFIFNPLIIVKVSCFTLASPFSPNPLTQPR